MRPPRPSFFAAGLSGWWTAEAKEGLVPKKIELIHPKTKKKYTTTVYVKPPVAAALDESPGAAKKAAKDAAHAAATAALADPGKANLKQLAGHLKTLTVAELNALKKSAGVKGGKLKTDVVDKILAHVKAKAAPPPPAPTPAAVPKGKAEPKPKGKAKVAPAPPADGPIVLPPPAGPSPALAPEPAPPATPAPKKPAGKADKADVEAHVKDYLKSAGLSAADALKKGGFAKVADALKKAGKVDSSVGHWEVDYALKNLQTQETDTFLPPMFAKGGAENKPNANLPDETRPKLTTAEAVAAQKYTGSAYQDLNAALREGKPPANSKLHADLQSAFAKAEPFTTPVTAKRALKIPAGPALDSFVAAAKHAQATGTTATMPGYLSTSVSDKGIGHFSGSVELTIKATHGLDLLPYTHYPHESEMLLNHGSKFKVKSVKQAPGGKWQIEMEQVPPGEGGPAGVTVDDKFKHPAGTPNPTATAPVGYGTPIPVDTSPPGGLKPKKTPGDHVEELKKLDTPLKISQYLDNVNIAQNDAIKAHLGLDKYATSEDVFNKLNPGAGAKKTKPWYKFWGK